ncbi:MAG: hypothetical protein R3D67_17810 [Hyphomicrobiaceae bacterium]
MRVLLAVLYACLVMFADAALAEAPQGRAPTFTTRSLSAVDNAEAVTRRLWAPGLDEGYVPQGLTVVGEHLFVSTYKSRETSQAKGPCRLYRLDMGTGEISGFLDLPAECGHAGGLARGPSGELFVADTRHVFVVRLDPKAARGLGQVVRTLRLAGDVRGSFAAGLGPSLWLGTYKKDESGKLYEFAAADLPDVIDESKAKRSLPLPLRAQGAAFDAKGQLWISQSSGGFGRISRLDPVKGAVIKSYATAIGVEDLSFDASGGLWTLSEAGSQRWNAWHQFYPLVFRLDVTKLK